LETGAVGELGIKVVAGLRGPVNLRGRAEDVVGIAGGGEGGHAGAVGVDLLDGVELLVGPVEQAVGGFEAVRPLHIGDAGNDVHGIRAVSIRPDDVSAGGVRQGPIDFCLGCRVASTTDQTGQAENYQPVERVTHIILPSSCVVIQLSQTAKRNFYGFQIRVVWQAIPIPEIEPAHFR